MTQTVTIREVNQHTSAVFERVRQGEELIVTKDGQQLARITPFRQADTYEQMIADGRVIPGDRLAAFQPMAAGVDIDSLLDQDRADRAEL